MYMCAIDIFYQTSFIDTNFEGIICSVTIFYYGKSPVVLKIYHFARLSCGHLFLILISDVLLYSFQFICVNRYFNV